MGLWDTAPSFNNPPTFNDLNDVKKYLKENINKIARSLQDIDFIINGTLNVDNIKANGIETKNLKAGAVTAEKITVNELSAISADLGSITAGIIRGIKIYGSLISTSETQYPRVVLDPSNTAFGVYADENNGVKIPAYDNGVSKIIFLENGNETTLYNSPTLGFVISGFDGIYITGTGITLDPISGFIRVPSWDKVINQDTGTSLQDEFDSIRSELAGKASISHSHSVSIPTHVHNPATSAGGGGTFSVS